MVQTRQADHDEALAEADARHGEAIAAISDHRQDLMGQQSTQLLTLLGQNTYLTELSSQMSQRIQQLTEEIHGQLVKCNQPPT